MTHAISYGRVSDAGQATGKSVDNQLLACREYAEKKGITIVGEFRDDGKSGTKLHTRNGAMDALTAIAEGDVDYLLVTETDRIARNSEENYIIRKHLKKHKCKLVAVNQSYTEGESEETDLIIGIMSNIDEFFSKINGKKTKRGMVKKIERGEWPGAAPLGFKNVDVGTEEKHHYVVQKDDETAPRVKEALELFSTGSYTAVTLRDIMHQRGLRSRSGKKIPKSSFIHMLKNSFYCGMMRYDGIMYLNRDAQGNETYEPLISRATYERNVALLGEHGKHADRSRKHDEKFYMRTILRCGICGGRVTAEVHEEKGKEYYHCSLTKQKHSNKGQNIDAKELEKLFAQLFGQIQLTEPLMQRIIAKAKEILMETHGSVDVKKRGVRNRIIKLEQRRDNLEEDRADKVIDAETYKRQHSKAVEEIHQLNQQLIELEGDRDVNIDIFNRLMLLTDDLQDTYTNAEPQLKRHLITLFFDRIAVKDRGISEVQHTKAIQVLRDNRAVIIRDKWLPRLDSNQRPWR